LSFRVWINFNWQKEREKDQTKEKSQVDKKESSSSDEEESKDPEKANQISKVIRLKRNRFNEEIFAYLRANLLNTYKGKNLPYLLVSAPVDAEFEMLVIACTINLLKGLLTSRFKTSLEHDKTQLKDP
jgi:basic membrane lipoprotein Med (substrate-binding protein (PBP1-ABC) superfamily)